MRACNGLVCGPGYSLPRAVRVIIDAEPPTSPSSCNAWDTSAKAISLSDKNAVWQSTTAAPYFEWAGATDNTGIAGYAVYYGNTDADPGTSSTTANAYYDAGADPGTSGTYYLNVRTIDVARNYSAKTTLFTVKYDGSAPNNPSTSSAWKTSGKTVTISSGVWQTETSNPYFEWDIPADNGASGLAGYYYYYGASAGGEPANWQTGNSYDAGADPGTAGIYYLRLKTKDNAGNISVSSTVFAVKYEGLPAITDLAASTGSAGAAISSDVWQPDNSPYFYWTEPGSFSAIEGYSWAWDAQPPDTIATPPGTNAFYQTPDGGLSNGQHTFYLKAKNNVGWGAAAQFSVWVDTITPDSPAVCSAWKTAGKTTTISSGVLQSTTAAPYFEWSIPADNGPSGIAGYYYYYGASAGADPVNWLTGNSYDAGADPGTSGIYYLRLKTRDNAGNVSVSSTVFVVQYDGIPVITDLAARTDSAGAAIPSDVWQPDNSPYFYWTEPVSYSAIEGYSWAWDAQPDDVADTPPGTSVFYQTPNGFLANGQHTFYIKAKNNVGWGSAASFSIRVNVSAPALSWTGETNYTADGLDPETGGRPTSFVYSVQYTDADNDSPQSGYPRVYILKSGTTVQILSMNYVSGTNTAGAVYSTATALAALGTDYSYHFEAYDVWGATAAGAPAAAVAAPSVLNNAPALTWTGEANYAAGGLYPETGNAQAQFSYRVKYTDVDNDAPEIGYPRLYILKAGTTVQVLSMSYASGANSTGAVYSTSTMISAFGTDYSYYFMANDALDAAAVGIATGTVDAPDVNNAPALAWTGETNYAADGLNPETGNSTTSFVYRVKYTDADNDAPGSGCPKVYILKGGTTVQVLAMEYVSGANSTGAIYSTATALSASGTDYSYHFAAYDVWGTTAAGTATGAVNAPDVNDAPVLAWTGDTNYAADGINPETGYLATSFVYRVKYTDADNDAPASGYPKLHIKNGGSELSGSPFTMTYVSGANNTGAVYTYSKMLPALGTFYTYYFEAPDTNGGQAAGAPTNPVAAPSVLNNAPALTWTGETNYTADGLDPETGYRATNFVYSVKYTDADNDAPASGYPRVYILKSGTTVQMLSMNYISGANSTGAIYSTAAVLSALGTDYSYHFAAYDVWGATAAPATPVDAPAVSNYTPVLTWTGEANYAADGLDPETGGPLTSFVYRVKYTDTDNEAPGSGYPKVHIKKGGAEISGSPFAMTYDTGAYNTGAVYTLAKTLAAWGTDYTCYFEAQDEYSAQATGAAVSTVTAPVVGNTAPVLGWTGEANYTADGLDPETGDILVNFSYRVKYTDADNDAPSSGWPKVHIKKGGSEIVGSPAAMTAADAGDNIYSDGKLYAWSTTLALGTDHTYYFEAQDANAAQATGAAASAVDAPDVGEILRQQGFKTTIGDNLFRPRAGGTAKIKFRVSSAGKVSLKIYGTSLKLVRTLFEGNSAPGEFQREWDGRDDGGHYVMPNIYFLHYVYPGGKEVRKIGVKK